MEGKDERLRVQGQADACPSRVRNAIICDMQKRVSTLPLDYGETRERRVINLERDGIPCIPVLAYNHFSSSRPCVALHSHPGIFECCFCIRGSLTFEYRDSMRHLLPGDAVVNQPGEWHRLAAKPKSMVMYTLFLRLGKPSARILRLPSDESDALRQALCALPHSVLKSGNRLRTAFQRLFRLYDELSPGAFRKLALRNAALDLLLILIETGGKKTEQNRSDRVARLIAEIRNHPEADYTIDRMTREAALSESQLATQFKERVGLPPYTFLLSCRIHAAKEQLRKSDRPITQIAQDMGFVSSQHFAMRFKREFGITPTAFRAGQSPIV